MVFGLGMESKEWILANEDMFFDKRCGYMLLQSYTSADMLEVNHGKFISCMPSF